MRLFFRARMQFCGVGWGCAVGVWQCDCSNRAAQGPFSEMVTRLGGTRPLQDDDTYFFLYFSACTDFPRKSSKMFVTFVTLSTHTRPPHIHTHTLKTANDTLQRPVKSLSHKLQFSPGDQQIIHLSIYCTYLLYLSNRLLA